MTSRSSRLLLLFLLMAASSCRSDEAVYTNDVILENYPKIAAFIVARDASALLEFADHADADVRSLSWRALAKSPISRPDSLVELVISVNEHAAWFGLSTHELSEKSKQRFRNVIRANPNRYMHACEVLKRQGEEPDLVLLLETLAELQDPGLCSAAAGAVLASVDVSDTTAHTAINAAFADNRPEVRRNLLYGIYRTPLNRPSIGSDAWNRLSDAWADHGIGREPATDQYMVGILGSEGATRFTEHVSFPGDVNDQQLTAEVIRSIDFSDYSRSLVKKLLSDKHPPVVTETLERLQHADTLDGPLSELIYENQVQLSRDAAVFVTAFELLMDHGRDLTPLAEKLAFMYDENPYLTNRFLTIYRDYEPLGAFLDRVERAFHSGGIRGLHAAQVLTEVWMGREDDALKDDVRRILYDAAEAGNASVVSGLSALLADEHLVRENDLDWLADRYQDAVASDNRTAAATFKQALETRFPDQHGELAEPDALPFKTPDWERLYALGTRPYWHLQTEKGEIVIQLDPISAPFTVSSIDSLTRAGAYNNVAFHRVIQNFVAQGGDVGRGDGFGGPGYRLPTEPSIRSFERGAVGIASSGTDTEGSQYFMMHQWKPHLDADYTLFGDVVRGLEVMDRLQVGDMVKKASISIH